MTHGSDVEPYAPSDPWDVLFQIKMTPKGHDYLVREKGLEPSRPRALAPKASVSTNSTTRARCHYYTRYGEEIKQGNRRSACGMIRLKWDHCYE